MGHDVFGGDVGESINLISEDVNIGVGYGLGKADCKCCFCPGEGEEFLFVIIELLVKLEDLGSCGSWWNHWMVSWMKRVHPREGMGSLM